MLALMHNSTAFISILLALFVAGGIYGFIYELLFYRLNDGRWLKRGTGFGPWIQLYAFGSILIFFASYGFRSNFLLVMLSSGLACGILEFLTGYVLFGLLGRPRSWDYNTEKWNWGNIGGYICFRSIAVFAISGLLLVYVLVPVFQILQAKFGISVFFAVVLIPYSLFMIDIIYNDCLAKICHWKDAQTFYEGYGWHHK